VTYPPPPAPYGTPPAPAPYVRKTNRGLIVALIVLAVLVLGAMAAGVVLFVLGRSDSPSGTGRHAVAIRFLQVTDRAPGACTTGGTPSADGSDCYRLGEGMAVTQVRNIRVAGPDSGNPGWRIEIELAAADAQAFAELTRKVSTEAFGSPLRQLAIVVGRKVVSAPAVQSAIPGGQVEIQGGYTKPTADRLVKQIIR
jgi:hypothetical protein